MSHVAPSLVASLACWTIGSSLWVYPHSLSYFNESIGGPLNGAAHLLGSNVDWGQDERFKTLNDVPSYEEIASVNTVLRADQNDGNGRDRKPRGTAKPVACYSFTYALLRCKTEETWSIE